MCLIIYANVKVIIKSISIVETKKVSMNIFLYSNAPWYLQPRNRHYIYLIINENCVLCIGYSPHWVSHAGTFRIAKKRCLIYLEFIFWQDCPHKHMMTLKIWQKQSITRATILIIYFDNLYSGSWLSNLNKSWPVKKNVFHLLKSLPSKIYFPWSV